MTNICFGCLNAIFFVPKPYLDMGDKDKAAADINVVRNRSHAKDIVAEDVTIDYILD